jgi:hypothetical protein
MSVDIARDDHGNKFGIGEHVEQEVNDNRTNPISPVLPLPQPTTIAMAARIPTTTCIARSEQDFKAAMKTCDEQQAFLDNAL